jgi:peptide/nickel transport system permease protein
MDFGKKIFRASILIKICFAICIIFFLCAVFANFLAPFDPDANDLMNRNKPPAALGGLKDHFLGTDQMGRDILSRCMFGLRVSVGIAVFGILMGSLLGVTLGLLSGMLGGWFDRIIMSLVDFQLSVPFILITLILITIFGSQIQVLIVLVGLAKWETYARVTRGLTLSVKEAQFVESAHAIGATLPRIVMVHIFPNILSTIVVLATLNFPSVLMLESSLSFLGIGVQAPTSSLGRMVGEGKNYLMTAWWVVMAPAFCILTVSSIMQILGDWLRNSLDVRMDID